MDVRPTAHAGAPSPGIDWGKTALQMGASVTAGIVGERVYRSLLAKGSAPAVLLGLAAAAGSKALILGGAEAINHDQAHVTAAALDGLRTGTIDGLAGIMAPKIHQRIARSASVGRIAQSAITGVVIGSLASGAESATSARVLHRGNASTSATLTLIGRDMAIGAVGGGVFGGGAAIIGRAFRFRYPAAAESQPVVAADVPKANVVAEGPEANVVAEGPKANVVAEGPKAEVTTKGTANVTKSASVTQVAQEALSKQPEVTKTPESGPRQVVVKRYTPATGTYNPNVSAVERYQQIRLLLDREIPTAVKGRLLPRWQKFSVLSQKWYDAAAKGTIKPGAGQQIAAYRMGASGTIMGRNGAIAGTNGAAIGTVNFNKAEQLVRQWVSTGEDLSLEKLLQLNKVLGEGLAHNGRAPGTLRNYDFNVAGNSHWNKAVPGQDVPKALADFMDWYNDAKVDPTVNPIELAARTYERLVTIHPYPDGNGRTCRFAMDWVLMRHRLPPASLTSQEALQGVFAEHTPPAADRAVQAVTNGVERTFQLMGIQ